MKVFSFKFSLGNLYFLDSGDTLTQLNSYATYMCDPCSEPFKHTHRHSWALCVCAFDMCVSIKHTSACSGHTHVVSVKKSKK